MKKIINFTPTGTQTTRNNSLAPLEVNEIIDEVIMAYEIGITITHLHARDEVTLRNTYKKEVYQKILEGIKKYCPDLILCVSLTGRNYPDFTHRSEVLQCKPDMASLTMSSLNFPSGASVNEPEMILSLISEMEKYGVIPELECFDSGMINYANYLISKDVLKGPNYMNIILGNMCNGQCDLATLASIKSVIPNNMIACVGGIGSQQLTSNLMGLLYFDGIRIGLEDNLYLVGKEKTTNKQLLQRAHNLMSQMNIELMSSKELKTLGYENKLTNNW
jgi:3-keto-5-aminohexanoate cleavage enzyme